ncbi:MAG: hypothetical protein ACYS8X_06075 [Planctomycetota bacterium]|jgi:hypothetical protein
MAVSQEYKKLLRDRCARWAAFHESRQVGDLMVSSWGDRFVSLESFLCEQMNQRPVEEVIDPRNVPDMIARYIELCHAKCETAENYTDDFVPEALVYWGIGGINAAITGGEPFYDGSTCWYEPELSWEQIETLRFDPDNKWVQFALHVNQALWTLWDEDFHVLAFLHRSPLDAANGIRGNELFEEMYTNPQAVHRLIDWCVDWVLAMEQFLADSDGRTCPPGWGTAVWGHWLPDRGIFVNGDPVGLISREMALEFEQPYTARLFRQTGGGFFHNHTIGLYQVDMVSATPGTLVQYFVDDPRQPSATEALLHYPQLREKMLAASLDAPIGMVVAPEDLDDVLDIIKHGRFVVVLAAPGEMPFDQRNELVRKVRRASNAG